MLEIIVVKNRTNLHYDLSPQSQHLTNPRYMSHHDTAWINCKEILNRVIIADIIYDRGRQNPHQIDFGVLGNQGKLFWRQGMSNPQRKRTSEFQNYFFRIAPRQKILIRLFSQEHPAFCLI
jgi:hypothetical protein